MRGLVISLFCCIAIHAVAQEHHALTWADSILSSLTLEEKVGQLFMIRAHSDLGPKHVLGIKNQIRKFHVGGLCFFQGTPSEQIRLLNEYQSQSKIPLLVAMDAEWGPGMRFRESALNFPRQLMLGAIQDNALMYELGQSVAGQLRDVGVHVNFAPVADVNINPLNPVINDRSFGEDRYNVTAKSYQYMRGMQDAGIIACAKHFPGHGDTDVDSHLDLPVIRHERNRLDSIELYPFKVLIDKGLQSMMVAHLSVPALDSRKNVPTTLSERVVNDLLRDTLGFEGLVFTDAMEMQGVIKHFDPGEAELLALEAGNDILTLPERIDQSVRVILEAVRSGRIAESDIDMRVRRILMAKYLAGLHQPVSLPSSPDMFSSEDLALKSRLIEQSLTAVSNDHEMLPLRIAPGQSLGTLMIGADQVSPFQKRLESYAPAKHIAVTQTQLMKRRENLFPLLRLHDVVVVGLSGMNKYAQKDFGLLHETMTFLEQLNRETEVVLVIFGSPYSLKFFEDFEHVVMAYQDDEMIQDIAAQAVCGAIPLKGRLPVTASEKFRLNHGIQIKSSNRLGYSFPESVGMSTDTLEQIRDVVAEMIDKQAAPGCQILVARDGKVVFHEAFGHFTYRRQQSVNVHHLYDIASVTKILATTLACMRLKDEGLLDPYKTLGDYLPELRNTNKEDLVIADILAHQAGLKSWIPFYEETVSGSRRNPVLNTEYYRSQQVDGYTVPVADKLYLRSVQVDSMWRTLVGSDLRRSRDYKYSDLGFYFLQRVVESISGKSLDAYCGEMFYRPLGLHRVLYNPLERFPRDHIAPSEEDKYFRKQRLQGHVHDSGAAMMGGIAGHAGLFGAAQDLAVLMQMLLNGGNYGGRTYLRSSTIDTFTSRYKGSTRRGLGFDMKEMDKSKRTFTSELSSAATYGHTGFTGTCVWNDPESKLLYVFLSNRTYPTMRNNELGELEIRERIHSLIYRAIGSSSEE